MTLVKKKGEVYRAFQSFWGQRSFSFLSLLCLNFEGRYSNWNKMGLTATYLLISLDLPSFIRLHTMGTQDATTMATLTSTK